MSFTSFMTWAGGGLVPLFQAELILRVVLAAGCGAAIGTERSRRLKEAGIRTHMVVACAAAVFMILSKYAFADMAAVAGAYPLGSRGTDSARIAAQVVSGVSFLGIGIIYKNGDKVTGLTTAAGIWATAAIGMAIGSGMYTLGILVTLTLLVLQYILHRFTVGNDAMQMIDIHISTPSAQALYPRISDQLKNWNVPVTELKIDQSHDGQNALISIQAKLPKAVPFQELTRYLAAQKDVSSFDCTPML